MVFLSNFNMFSTSIHVHVVIPRVLGCYHKYPKECVDNPQAAAIGVITHEKTWQ